MRRTDPNHMTKQKLLESLTPREREIIEVVAHPGSPEQLTVQQINNALDQARFIGDL